MFEFVEWRARFKVDKDTGGKSAGPPPPPVTNRARPRALSALALDVQRLERQVETKAKAETLGAQNNGHLQKKRLQKKVS